MIHMGTYKPKDECEWGVGAHLHRDQCALSLTDTQDLCQYASGTWSEWENGYQCSSPDWPSSILVEDRNEDGFVQIDEHWCEGKDDNGNPNGQEEPCPYEDWEF
jgi:hypothetical protein